MKPVLVASALARAACGAAPALAAEPPAHSRFLLGVSVNEGLGGVDGGLGGTYATFMPAPSVRVSYFLGERLELGGGATYQAMDQFSDTACIGPWNKVSSVAFIDVTTRYNFTWGKTGFWYVGGGLLGGVAVHTFHDFHFEQVEGDMHARGVSTSSGERGSPAFGGKVQTGGGSWITPRVRWSLGLEYYMGMVYWQLLGDTKAAGFGQLSLMLGLDFGII